MYCTVTSDETVRAVVAGPAGLAAAAEVGAGPVAGAVRVAAGTYSPHPTQLKAGNFVFRVKNCLKYNTVSCCMKEPVTTVNSVETLF